MTEQRPPTTQDVPPDDTAPIDPEDDSGFVDVIPEPDLQPKAPQPITDQPTRP
jgi:hypothetical protein